MTDATSSPANRIRALNDAFRRTFVGGAVVITAGVEALPADQRRSILAKVRAFDAFTRTTTPTASTTSASSSTATSAASGRSTTTTERWRCCRPIPPTPSVTTRVLTVMLADEY